MSICTYAWTGYVHYTTTFLGYGGRGGQCGWPFVTFVFVELNAKMSAERS